MTSEEFIKACVDSGYITRFEKKKLREWLDRHPKDSYTESDFITVYRHFNTSNHNDTAHDDKWQYTGFGNRTTYKRVDYDYDMN